MLCSSVEDSTQMAKKTVRCVCGLSLLALASGAACNSTSSSDRQPPAPCTAASADGGIAPPSSSAEGTFVGSDVAAALCIGGAEVRLEHTSAAASLTPLFLAIHQATVDPATDFQFAAPANATRGELAVVVSVGAAQPGTYTESGTCGDISVCVVLPVPASVSCPSVLQGDVCPPGCAVVGPGFCAAVEPTVCYEAIAATDCAGGSFGGPRGSWSLQLTSVEPFPTLAGGSGDVTFFTSHGSLTATLVEIPGSPSIGTSSDGGPPTATLKLRF
jgi:hypothetical protein